MLTIEAQELDLQMPASVSIAGRECSMMLGNKPGTRYLKRGLTAEAVKAWLDRIYALLMPVEDLGGDVGEDSRFFFAQKKGLPRSDGDGAGELATVQESENQAAQAASEEESMTLLLEGLMRQREEREAEDGGGVEEEEKGGAEEEDATRSDAAALLRGLRITVLHSKMQKLREKLTFLTSRDGCTVRRLRGLHVLFVGVEMFVCVCICVCIFVRVFACIFVYIHTRTRSCRHDRTTRLKPFCRSR